MKTVPGKTDRDEEGKRADEEVDLQDGEHSADEGVPEADKKMGHFGMAMVSLPGGDFLLLASERDLLKLNNASTEEIQDHKCAVLDPMPQ